MGQITKLLVPAVAASVLLSACGGSSGGGSPSGGSTGGSTGAALVKTASNATIGSTVLVDTQGMTLYRLSGETNGKWICTKGCLQAWHPLVAPSAGAPTGSVGSLATVKRPDGTMQVTFKGEPLYTFASDQSPGDAKGQGIKDVGTWNAVTSGAAASAPASSSSGGGSGY